jgi:MFS transporter, ACS family, glucarate transporter
VTGPAIPASRRPPLTRPRVRWRIYLFLFLFGLIAYLQARSIPVAGVQMMSQLGLTNLQLGGLETAFLIGYTLLQFPGGVLGQRLGARRMFVIIGLLALGAALATPLAPWFLAGAALLIVLHIAQFVLGAAQAPIFPVSAGVFEVWFTPDKWPLVQGVQSMALGLGAAIAPPLISQLMSAFDWQRALLWTTVPALVLIIWWGYYARNTPAEHPRVSVTELAELGENAHEQVDQNISWGRIWELLKNRDLLLLTGSYVCMNYVYYLLANWCFLYLIQERHFTVLESGWLASTPPLAAAIGAGAGGQLASVLGRRYGIGKGLRILPLLSLPAAGVLQYLAVDAINAYMAVAALALCFACVELNEGPYWAAIMHVGRGDTMAASGILNTGGNLGGIIATPIVGHLADQHAWTAAFLIGTVFALLSATAWLWVNPTRYAAGSAVPQPMH